MRCPRCKNTVSGWVLFQDLQCGTCSAKLKPPGHGALAISLLLSYLLASCLFLTFEPTPTSSLVILVLATVLGICFVWWFAKPIVEQL